MVTTTKTTGFDGLCCPECGNESAIIMMDLMTLGEFRCEDCSETFTVIMAVKKASETLEAWRKIERLVELARQLAAE
jgi:hypothetical protein